MNVRIGCLLLLLALSGCSKQTVEIGLDSFRVGKILGEKYQTGVAIGITPDDVLSAEFVNWAGAPTDKEDAAATALEIAETLKEHVRFVERCKALQVIFAVEESRTFYTYRSARNYSFRPRTLSPMEDPDSGRL